MNYIQRLIIGALCRIPVVMVSLLRTPEEELLILVHMLSEEPRLLSSKKLPLQTVSFPPCILGSRLNPTLLQVSLLVPYSSQDGPETFSRVLNLLTTLIRTILTPILDKLKHSKYGTTDSLDHITKRFDETTKRLFRDSKETQFVHFGSPLDKDIPAGIRMGQLKLTGLAHSF